MMNSTRNTKNNTCAIELAVPAIPPKPSTAAIKAITRNVIAQLNMMHHPFSNAESGFAAFNVCGLNLQGPWQNDIASCVPKTPMSKNRKNDGS
jgi:hypothetical protein